MTINEEIGRKIRKARSRLRLTQEELGDLLGIERSMISHIELGADAMS